MFPSGIICKGRGFNCGGCKDKDICDQYLEPNFNISEIPVCKLLKEYIGVYHQPYIETITVKIKALDETQAEARFVKYLKDLGIPNYRLDEDNIILIDLESIEVLE